MKESNWLQRNAFLAAAAALPVVVVLFFLAATAIPKWTVDDPVYDPIFAVTRYDRGTADLALEFKMEDGRLQAVARRLPNTGYGTYQQLYRYRVSTGKLDKLAVEIPADVRRSLESATIVAGQPAPSETFESDVLDGLALHTDPVAPDGYEFVHEYSGGSGLLGGLLGIRSRGHRLGLSKNGRLVPIEAADGGCCYPSGGVSFLAWTKSQ